MKKLLKIFIIILILPVSLWSKNYYVASDGKDSNSGISENESFQTINKAVNVADAGDTIYIMPGSYKEIIDLSGKNGKPELSIVISGYAKDSTDYPVIDGGAIMPGLELTNYWMTINNSSWITVEKIKFINGWTDPIQLKNSSYISFNKCIFFGGRKVIDAGGINTHHILIENCYWDQGGEYLWTVEEDSAGVEAWLSMHHERMAYFNGSIIDFRKTGGSVIIRNNIFKNTFNAVRWRGERGYDENVEIYGNYITQVRDNDFEPETYTYNLHIYHNYSHNVHRTLSVDNVTGGYIYYYGNVITTENTPWTRKICTGFGKIYGSERELDYPLYIFNNSFYGVAKAYRVDVGNIIKTKHFNNAFFFTAENEWVLDNWDSSNEFDYDISNRDWPENIKNNNQEMHGLVDDVKFADPENQNLHLKDTSPAVDAGKNMSFEEFDWTQSYAGDAPDIGAYENGELVEGPPFRFIPSSESEITYKEKPRIVKSKIEGKQLNLFFSAELNPSSISQNIIDLYESKNKVSVESVTLDDDNYSVTINTGSSLEGKKILIAFKNLPVGANGETATTWASVIPVKK